MKKSKLFILKNPIFLMNKSKLFISKSSVKYTIQWQIQRSESPWLTHWSLIMRDTLVGQSTHRLMTDTLVYRRPIDPWQTSCSVTVILVHDRQNGQLQTYWSMTDKLVCHRHNDPWQKRWSVTDILIHDRHIDQS